MALVTDPIVQAYQFVGITQTCSRSRILQPTTYAALVCLAATQAQDPPLALQQQQSLGKQQNHWSAVRPLCH
jgi:hypothetical protein